MSLYEHEKNSNLDNPQTVNWLNILPPLNGKKIIKVGTQKINNIDFLIKCNCKSGKGKFRSKDIYQ